MAKKRSDQENPKPKSESDTLYDSAGPVKETESEKLYNQAGNSASNGDGKAPAAGVGAAADPAAVKSAAKAARDAANREMFDAIKSGKKITEGVYEQTGHVAAIIGKGRVNLNLMNPQNSKVGVVGRYVGLGSAIIAGVDGLNRMRKGAFGTEKIGSDGQITKGNWGDFFFGAAETTAAVTGGILVATLGGKNKIIGM